jgi:hypothetical protein
MRLSAAAAVFGVSILAAVAVGAREDQSDRLPEPPLQFAKEAVRAVAEEERRWLERVDEPDALRESGPRPTARPLSAEAAALLARSQDVLTAYRSADRDLGRFRKLLREAAARDREVADLYVAAGGRAKSAPVREDFEALVEAYRHRAGALDARADMIGLSAGAAERAALLEEGNRFLERLAEVAAAVPVGAADERLLAARLGRHSSQCDALVEELAKAARTILAGSDVAVVRQEATAGKQTLSVKPRRLDGEESLPAPPVVRKDHFTLSHIRPTQDWAALITGPDELSVGANLTCERRGVGPVGTLQVVSYSSDARVFVVRALGSTQFEPGDVARR